MVLGQSQRTTASAPRVAATGAQGVVRFDRLPVGRYHLAEMSGGWCRAEADGLNAAGEIIVEGGQTMTVSIVNCGAPPGAEVGETPE